MKIYIVIKHAQCAASEILKVFMVKQMAEFWLDQEYPHHLTDYGSDFFEILECDLE